MLKNFFATILLAMIILFCSQNNFVEAKDIYVGTSDATGWDCYVMTETLVEESSDRFGVNLKMVTRSKEVKYLSYMFWRDSIGSSWHFKNSQGYSGMVSGDTPIEWNMVRAFRGSPKAY